MAKTILGKVGMTPKGAYNNTTEYVRLDVVTKNGQSYVCKKNCSGKDVTNTTYWQLIAGKGEMPVNGVDYNTEEDKQAFKEAVVEDSKIEMDNYTADKKEELDTHTIDKKTELNNYKKDLEDEMSTTKENLVEDINNATTENINEFNSNAETKTNAFNDNATEKTTNYNINAETKLKEYNDNTIAKLEEYNTNATNKVEEFNENVDSLENELTELANQMPWNTTEIQDSINVNDSAKYSRNKLGIFGNLEQETSVEGRNICPTDFYEWELGQWDSVTGEKSSHNNRLRVKRLIKVEPSTAYYYDLFWSKPEGETLDAVVLIRKYDINKNFIGVVSTYLNKGIHTTSSDEYYISITLGQGGQNFTWTYETFETFFENGIIKPLWCLNSETDKTFTEYVPNKPTMEYPSTPVVATGVQKISRLGKNYLDISNTEISTEIGVSIKVEDNKITLNGTATKNLSVTIASDLDIALNGEYTFSQKVLSGSFSEGAYRIYLRNNSITDMFDSPLTFTSTTQKMTNTCNVLLTHLAMFINKGNVFNNYVIALQVEKGNEETPYEQPKEKEIFELDLGTTELCKILDENNNVVAQDRAVYKDGKWQWEKNVSKFINNGTNLINYKLVTSYVAEDLLAFVFNADHKHVGKTIAINSDKMPSKYLGHVENINDSNSVRVTEGIAVHDGNTNQIVCSIKKSRLQEENLNGITQFLTENNLTMYFPALVPTYEDCTPAQSEVLDKLYKLSLEKGTNNIYVESENGVTTELQLTYMQDNNIRISNMQEQINALSKAVLDLGGNE